MYLKPGINMQTNMFIEIQNLSWILNINYCIPDEKYSRKHVTTRLYCLFFVNMFVSFWEEEKREKYS